MSSAPRGARALPTWTLGKPSEFHDRLLALVLDGVKTPTASLAMDHELDDEPAAAARRPLRRTAAATP